MTNQEHEIRTAVLDYFEGWFDGDVERMDRALHHGLVKRRGAHELGMTTKERMIELTAQGEGKPDGADRSLDIRVHDVFEDIANVTVQSAVYQEYVQLVHTPDGWKIANTLWQLR